MSPRTNQPRSLRVEIEGEGLVYDSRDTPAEGVPMNANRAVSLVVMYTATILMGMSRPMSAEVVYIPVHKTILNNGSLRGDIDHDGRTDFTLVATSQVTVCGNRGGFTGNVTLAPAEGNGVVVSHLDFAALLPVGTEVGPGSDFYQNSAIVDQFLICNAGQHDVEGYLGLEFLKNGETHYAWTFVQVDAFYSFKNSYLRVTVLGVAYETDPGVPITTGQQNLLQDGTLSGLSESDK